MPDLTADEVATDRLFAEQGGQILCEGIWDRSNGYTDAEDGTWATTSTGITFYDADNDGHWDAAGRAGGSDGFRFDGETGQWVPNDLDGLHFSYNSCYFPTGDMW